MKKPTKTQLDKQILDHADEIVRLMKMKGYEDDSADYGISHINVNNWHDGIQVDCQLQKIETIRRAKK